MGNIYAVGDIHGCYDRLITLMDKIDIDFDRDLLVFLGDYIDRGPSSYEVVDFMIKLKKRYPDTVFLKGNHEEMLSHYLSGLDRYTYLVNGGQKTIDDYMERAKDGMRPIPSSHVDFFSSLSLYYQTDQYIFVHAGLKEETPLSFQRPDDLLWIRERFIYSKYDFGKRIIFGHTPFSDPLVMANKIGIDTGAVYGNRLTCIKLPQIEFYYA